MSSAVKGHPEESQQPRKLHLRQAVVRLTSAAAAAFLVAPAVFAGGPPEVVIRPAPQPVKPLTAQEKKLVQDAIDRAIAYLKRTQLPTGTWIVGREGRTGRYLPLNFAAGFAGLGGLALLESGVPAKDPAVEAAARFIRQSGPGLFRTYDLAL